MRLDAHREWLFTSVCSHRRLDAHREWLLTSVCSHRRLDAHREWLLTSVSSHMRLDTHEEWLLISGSIYYHYNVIFVVSSKLYNTISFNWNVISQYNKVISFSRIF